MTATKKGSEKRRSVQEHLTTHIPHSVSVAFFGVLLTISLGANLWTLFQSQKEPNLPYDGLPSPMRLLDKNHILYQGHIYSPKEENGVPISNETQSPFEISFLQDSTCPECVDLNTLRESFTTQFPNATIRDIDASSEEGQGIIRAGIGVLPAVVFPKSFENSPLFSELSQNGILLPVGEQYYEFRTGGNKVVLNAEQLPKTEAIPGKVIVVGYVDFLSPEGGNIFTEIIPNLLTQFGDNLSFDIRPFAGDPASAVAAEAVLCGTDPALVIEKGKVFLENLNTAFSGVDASDEAQVEAIFQTEVDTFAGNLGLDETQKSCLKNHEKQADLIESVNGAAKLGINGAPAFFVDRYFLGGEQNTDVFSRVISSLLQ